MTNITIEQVAEAMSIGKRSAERRAARECWPYTEETCRGGRRRRYPLASLPADVRRAVERWQDAQAVERLPAVASAPTPVAASSGDSIRAGLPSPAHSSPAATGAGGVAGAGGAGCAFAAGAVHGVPQGYQTVHTATADANAGNGPLTRGAGSIPAARTTDSRALAGAAGAAGVISNKDSVAGWLMDSRMEDESARGARLREEALRRLRAITPLVGLPEHSRGRRALAEQAGRELGLTVAQVYRLVQRYQNSGRDLWALVPGGRRDRGMARVVVSAAFERLMTGFLRTSDMDAVASRLVELVRSSWASGAPSAYKAWALATARLADELLAQGWSAEQARALALLPCPRRFVEAERKYSLVNIVKRDAKRAYAEFTPSVARTVTGFKPGDLVFGDVSPLDIPIKRPDGSMAYARMITWMDAATCWMHVTLHLCEKGRGVRREHVAASFASLCNRSPIGMPQRLYLDNGSEYKWEDMLLAWRDMATLTGQRMVTELSDGRDGERARIIRSIPFRPRGKSIESRFGNMRYWFGWHPAYVGGNRMTKRIERLGGAPTGISFDEAASFVAGVVADYHATAQTKGGYLDGKSPQAALDAALAAGWKPMRVDEAALHLAFSERFQPVVRGGKVQVAGKTWFCDALVGRMGRVEARLPRIEGLADILYLFEPNGRFIGCAEPERLFGLIDGAGAAEAGRRGKLLRVVTNELAGQVEVVDPAQFAGLRGRLLGVDETAQRAMEAAETVSLAPEMVAMLEADRKAREEAVNRVLAEVAARKQADSLARLVHGDTPEEAEARALFG